MKNSPLDLSVNAVLDVTPRKIGKMAFGLAKGVYGVITRKKVRELQEQVKTLEEANKAIERRLGLSKEEKHRNIA